MVRIINMGVWIGSTISQGLFIYDWWCWYDNISWISNRSHYFVICQNKPLILVWIAHLALIRSIGSPDVLVIIVICSWELLIGNFSVCRFSNIVLNWNFIGLNSWVNSNVCPEGLAFILRSHSGISLTKIWWVFEHL